MRFILSTFLLISLIPAYSQTVHKTPAPSWITPVSYADQSISPDAGGYQYLLYSTQVNLEEQESFWKVALKVLSPDGIQQMSDITIDFDPSYQSLHIHELQVVRDGEVFDRLPAAEFRTIQREQGLERSLYDGSVTAVINLTDIRQNDIILYSYSIQGVNPVFQGHYSNEFYLKQAIPVNRLFYLVVMPENIKLHYKQFAGAPAPKISESAGGREYIWDTESMDYVMYDSNVPGWYDPLPKVTITTYSSWKEVAEWAVPLFEYGATDRLAIEEIASQWNNYAPMPLTPIRFVQDEIRYLGFESGISAYKPHPPAQVAGQRYGDCKDKSLLLVALLREKGFEAYPVLVNTVLKDELVNTLPNPKVFDHCIVTFKKDSVFHFVDPTIANQGGNLQHMVLPDYRYGLVIKAGETQLTEIPTSPAPTISVQELITVSQPGGNTDMIVRTEYTGSRADFIRQYFRNESNTQISKQYTEFYRNLYPSIYATDSVHLYDYERNTTNKVIVEEYYAIPEFWRADEDSTQLSGDVYPLILENFVNLSQSAERTMPYYLGEPITFTQVSQLEMPEPWFVNTDNTVIDGKGFYYASAVSQSGNTIVVRHNYELSRSHISAEEVTDVLASHDRIMDELSFTVFDKTVSATAGSGKWFTYFLLFLSLAGFFYLGYRVYRHYDPPAYKYAQNKPIGSWLILPAIGVVLSPVLIGYDVINTFIDVDILALGSPAYVLLIIGELIANSAMFVLALLVAVLFFKRRSSLPRIITIAYLAWFLIPLLDFAAVYAVMPEYGFMGDEELKLLIRTFLSAAIWVPVFNISERVKSTFCLQYGEKRVKSAYLSDRLRTSSAGATLPGDLPVAKESTEPGE